MRTSIKLITLSLSITILLSLLSYSRLTSRAQESGPVLDDEPPESGGPLTMYFIDDPGGAAAIVDIGPHEIFVDGGNGGALRKFLTAHPGIVDGPIELVVCTRNSRSNWIGLKSLFEPISEEEEAEEGEETSAEPAKYRVLEFWEPGYERWEPKKEARAQKLYAEFLEEMKRQVPAENFKRPLEEFYPPASKTKELRPIKLNSIPEATFFVLHSDKDPPIPSDLSRSLKNLYPVNNSSIVLMIEIEGLRMLFGGSIWGKASQDPASSEPKFVERELLAVAAQHPAALKSDLLLAPFNGSESASTQKFIEAVSPRFVVFNSNPISSLPRATVVNRYERIARVFSTGVHKEANRDHIVCKKQMNDEQRTNNDLTCGYVSTAPDSEAEDGFGSVGWSGRTVDGKEITLNRVTNAIRELAVNPQDDLFKEADLSGIDLHRRRFRQGFDLSGTNLSWSNLSGTDLSRVRLYRANLAHSYIDSNTILNEADLRDVDLSSAKQPQHLRGANLSGATVGEIDLSKADLTDTNLSNVNLSLAKIPKKLDRTVLTGAVLNNANLRGASLIGGKLDGVRLQDADLTDAKFEPLPGFVPHINELVTVKYLTTLTFETSPHALVELREAFKQAGLRKQERELTYAIERGRNSKRGGVEYWFNRLLFDLPCQYGLNTDRPLIILAGTILLFAIPYMMSLFTRGAAGIWAVWMPERIDKRNGETNDPIRLRSDFEWSRLRKLKGIARWIRVVFIGLYFSVVSAFQIGYRDFNIGSWISRVQSREYTLRATGWVRVVSGIQSLVSVYLLALWLLTYFGRPFD